MPGKACVIINHCLILYFRRVILIDQAKLRNELILSHNALLAARGIGRRPARRSYTGVTALLFYLFGPGNFIARVWPAIFGASIAIPWFWKDLIGKKPAWSELFAGNESDFVTFSGDQSRYFCHWRCLWVLTLIKIKDPIERCVLGISFLSVAAF